ncbi:LEA type 2 family protein [Vulcaniibacterium gelatinicum]|uniref:NDR1/HIN1-like protein n=1 Tax=Vulcaniibacterium gelatinicum TaxID=2598725 RepID=UPI0011CB5816|nr:LEA type 2 family protein [Vulcaniibacterium gelatinicum]
MKAWLGVALLCCAGLAGCGGGPVRRVSEPSASVQQLTVHADGTWSVDLRLQNYSSVPMRFDSISLAFDIGGQSAGTLAGQPGLAIGPESADVVTLALQPASAARIAVAAALAERRSLPYTLRGQVQAAPEDARARRYDIERSSALSPVPGVPGVMR